MEPIEIGGDLISSYFIGTYYGGSTDSQFGATECTKCPSDRPYTSATGSTAIDQCGEDPFAVVEYDDTRPCNVSRPNSQFLHFFVTVMDLLLREPL